MIEDGPAVGLMIAFQHLLRTLERKRVLSVSETTEMLDGVLNELNGLNLAPKVARDAHVTVGGLYLPKR